MNWDKLRLFVAVAETGRLSLAASKLSMSQSALSRQVAALESEIGVPLFHRHARGLLLTEQGNILFEAASSMSKQLESAAARIRDSRMLNEGELRVTTTVGFGSLWLAPRLPRFFDEHPQININLMLEERILDLAMREADCAIRMKEPSQADLIRRKIMTTEMRLYASREFLRMHGKPQSLKDLRRLRLISHNSSVIGSTVREMYLADLAPFDMQPHMLVNNYYGILQAVRNDLGIGIMPDYVARHLCDVVEVLPEMVSKNIPMYFAYPVELRDSCRLKAFRDFVVREARAFLNSA
ncbi:MAG: LysR family transcriptional regulator [Rhodobacteraceae bacterium]|nr:LysR family transcriptional regulator [Paracoccaceae bacterium]